MNFKEEKSKKIRFKVLKFEEIDSTNLYLERNCNSLPSSVAIAKTQNGGLGRLKRSFYSPKGGLYISFLIKEKIPAQEIKLLTPCIAVKIKQVLSSCNINTQIKWVNDLYLNGKKVCGILCKTKLLDSDYSDYVIVGIGLNLNVKTFPQELENKATSVYLETKKCVNISKIAKKIIKSMQDLPLDLKEKNFKQDYRESSFLTGKTVLYNNEEVVVLGINDDLNLLVEKNGEVLTLNTGEVVI